MSARRKNPLFAALDASFLIGAICSIIFYAIVLSPGMRESLVYRYTAEHPVEYVVVALSFWGLVDVLRKLFSYPSEVMALRQDWLPARTGREPVENAQQLLETLTNQPAWMADSLMGKRLTAALEYVVENGVSEDYREQLKSLADQDSDRLHAQHTLVRFVARITPVLGFLGTVVHFGSALNGITLDKMSEQLGLVVSQMGQAFNTTTVALGSAMFMMFAQFVCEWIERTILHSVDRYVDRQLATRFQARDANVLPFLRVVRDANDDALRVIAANIDHQTAAWTEAMATLFSRFETRQEKETEAWTNALDVLSRRHENYDAVREERLRQLIEAIDDRQMEFVNHIHASFEKATTLRNDVQGLLKSLHEVAEGEGRIAELQTILSENLRVLHEAGQIEAALHELTGAIHLLTARHKGDGRKAA